MNPLIRRFALTGHVMASVGWLGAVVAYLVLASAAVNSEDVQVLRAAYPAMEVMIWGVIVPFAFASLGTGIVSSVGTTWGLLRHYWVIFKLVINVFATVVLLMYAPSTGLFAGLAAKSRLSTVDIVQLRNPTHVIHAGGAIFLLMVATVLAIYKPRAMTAYGRRKQQEQRRALIPEPAD